MNNPSSLHGQPAAIEAKKEFIARLQVLQQQGFTLRDKIEGMQMDCDNKADKLRNIVTPLSELEEREVGTLEVKGVKRDEEALLRELGLMNQQLNPQEKEIQALDEAVKDLINSDKDDRLAQALGKLTELDI